MTLPTSLDPEAVALAAAYAEQAVDAPGRGLCTAAKREVLIERCVALMMEAGVYVHEGQLFMPAP
jgi:hypothetical protein